MREQTKIKSSTKSTIITFVLLSCLGLSACTNEKQEQTETAEDKSLEQKIEDAGESAENAIEGAAKSVETALNDAEKQLSKLVDKSEAVKQVNAVDQIKTHTGMIVYKDFEGGFYAFEGDKGERFTLIGTNETYQKHGLIVEITGTPVPNTMTTTQFGTVFKLNSIKVLDASKVNPAPDNSPKS